MNNNFRQVLAEWGMTVDPGQEQLFARYLGLIQSENKKINLTSIVDTGEIIEKHFLDSLALVPVVGRPYLAGPLNLIDIGAGAGLPGIPLKIIFPALKLTLADSVKKKVCFLERVVSELGLADTSCVAERAETLGQDAKFREQYDLVVAKAVAKMNVLAELLLPLIKIGGLAAIYKGEDIEEELARAGKAIEILGGAVTAIKKFALGNNKRSIVLIKKIKNTPAQYPRKPGRPEKGPL